MVEILIVLRAGGRWGASSCGYQGSSCGYQGGSCGIPARIGRHGNKAASGLALRSESRERPDAPAG